MKRVLVASLAAVIAIGMSGAAEAHGYPAPAVGSVYWADNNVVIGLHYGAPYVAPYYAPPRYVYRPRVYRPAYHVRHHGHHKDDSREYRKDYYKGYRRGHGHDRHGHGRRDWDD